MRRALLGLLPNALDGVEVGRVGRKPVQLDSMTVCMQPIDSFDLQVVTGTVVDDEEDFATCCTDKLLQEGKECVAVEHGGKHVVKSRASFQRHCPEHMGGLS